MEPLLSVQNLNKAYQKGKENAQQVLQNCTLSIAQGEFIAIMGASGSGKSTLLYQISGMDRPTSGTVTFMGTEFSSLSERQLAKFRLEKMGFIFQQAHFLKNLNIFDNIILPAYLNNKVSRAEVNDYASQLMEQTDILALKEKDITQVSGGQLQRASICRALMNRPVILFGDEPTGALNSKAAGEVMEIFHTINAAGTTIMLVTHDPKVAAQTERILYMSDGTLAGELCLGKYTQGAGRQRESELSSWLFAQGF